MVAGRLTVMKNLPVIVSVIVAAMIWGSAISYARPRQRFDPDARMTRELEFKNIRAGYRIFMNLCKSCHNRENEKAPFLHTESRTMQGWNNVFHKRYPKCAKEGYWDELTSEDLLKLNDYLYYYAYDAYDPYDPWDNDGFWFFFN